MFAKILTVLTFLALVAAQNGGIAIPGPGGSANVNGFDCPGPIWNGVCCVGKVEGPAVSAFHSSMDNLGPSIAAEVSSNLVAAGLIPKVTPRANIAKRDSEIASGVTCVGTAIPFGASDYSAQLSRASVKGAGSGGATATGATATATSDKDEAATSTSSTNNAALTQAPVMWGYGAAAVAALAYGAV